MFVHTWMEIEKVYEWIGGDGNETFVACFLDYDSLARLFDVIFL